MATKGSRPGLSRCGCEGQCMRMTCFGGLEHSQETLRHTTALVALVTKLFASGNASNALSWDLLESGVLATETSPEAERLLGALTGCEMAVHKLSASVNLGYHISSNNVAKEAGIAAEGNIVSPTVSLLSLMSADNSTTDVATATTERNATEVYVTPEGGEGLAEE
ncbi:hypothetical protein NDU88_005098 [Pleurodeles waltl]|uniref:Uncharacterized protein n=1 Tax=Pleurodeles waltl TaxID=8319 RepID=A0AAV7MDK6_PLEWA|nr:hypothetical protein NDU88_005098 [Pleurodeles waltl]